ncbi:Demethylmenaquinone methyltransferase [Metarhizium acridum CQMa 102]|uniref:Demethylmenaquinone methyltransferase n=1 Tax=Metarhizium acridum (strain CQMa 102) TaxID=655827 RepID=E9DYI2_METAQ|nr:Demethylmenaquinone methyltransferase [Metarhizium acridum CQMa 102]EFY91252.1 Demethylmenaquinone methyltransferase [Metarhizium acridum CQMa 102]
MSTATLARLEQYTACDISDALLKLKVPGAGFIADLNPYSTKPGKDADALTIAPVSTILFAAKGEVLPEPQPNVPKDTHWSDATEPGTFVVMKQPPGQTNAVCGGIMALRMKMRNVKGIMVAGRVRDVQELKSTSLPVLPFPTTHLDSKVLAHGLSTVGSGGGSVPWAMQVPLDINGVTVSPGDIAFQDPVNGVVIIPGDKVDQVLEMLPKLVAADDKVKQDVLKGMSVYDAFKLHRGT